jgi:hypothetical protein
MGIFPKAAVQKRQAENIGGTARQDRLVPGRYRLRVSKYTIAPSSNPKKKNTTNSLLEVEVLQTLTVRSGSYEDRNHNTVEWESQTAGDLAAIKEFITFDGDGEPSSYKDDYALQRVVNFGAFILGTRDFPTEALEELGSPANPLKGVEFTIDITQRRSGKTGSLITDYNYSDLDTGTE